MLKKRTLPCLKKKNNKKTKEEEEEEEEREKNEKKKKKEDMLWQHSKAFSPITSLTWTGERLRAITKK